MIPRGESEGNSHQEETSQPDQDLIRCRISNPLLDSANPYDYSSKKLVDTLRQYCYLNEGEMEIEDALKQVIQDVFFSGKISDQNQTKLEKIVKQLNLNDLGIITFT